MDTFMDLWIHITEQKIQNQISQLKLLWQLTCTAFHIIGHKDHNLLFDLFLWAHWVACAIYDIIAFIHLSTPLTTFPKRHSTDYTSLDCDPKYKQVQNTHKNYILSKSINLKQVLTSTAEYWR